MENTQPLKQLGTSPNTWTSIMYISTLLNVFPFSNIVVPLIMWLLKKDKNRYIDTQGRQIINFQITFTILLILCFGSYIFSLKYTIVPAIINWLPMVLVILGDFILMILGAVRAYQGKEFNLPFLIRFIK